MITLLVTSTDLKKITEMKKEIATATKGSVVKVSKVEGDRNYSFSIEIPNSNKKDICYKIKASELKVLG